MLIGEFNHTLDNKGRVIVPSHFREEFPDRVIITRGLEKSLFVYSLDEWANMEKKLRAMPLAKAEARDFLRIFFSGAAYVELDKQGRILVPISLREYASLEKEVAFIGVSSRAEIWNRAYWREYSSKRSSSYEQIAEELIDFEI